MTNALSHKLLIGSLVVMISSGKFRVMNFFASKKSWGKHRMPNKRLSILREWVRGHVFPTSREAAQAGLLTLLQGNAARPVFGRWLR